MYRNTVDHQIIHIKFSHFSWGRMNSWNFDVKKMDLNWLPINKSAYNWPPLHKQAYNWLPKHKRAYNWLPLHKRAYDWLPIHKWAYNWLSPHKWAYHWLPIHKWAYNWPPIHKWAFNWAPILCTKFCMFYCIGPHSCRSSHCGFWSQISLHYNPWYMRLCIKYCYLSDNIKHTSQISWFWNLQCLMHGLWWH